MPPNHSLTLKYFLTALALLLLATPRPAAAQTPDPWRISADKVDPRNYYGATVANGMGGIFIGARTHVGIANVLIGPLRIGNDVIIAQNVVFSGLNHGYEDVSLPIRNQKCSAAEIVVEDEVWIGANAVITAGVHIGRHAVVAGGSVVTKDVPAYSVVGGNPARILRQHNPATGQWERHQFKG